MQLCKKSCIFLLNRSLSSDEINAETKAKFQICPSDLEDVFTDEFLMFSQARIYYWGVGANARQENF